MQGPDYLEVHRNLTKRASREDIFCFFSSPSRASGDITARAGIYQNAMYASLNKILPPNVVSRTILPRLFTGTKMVPILMDGLNNILVVLHVIGGGGGEATGGDDGSVSPNHVPLTPPPADSGDDMISRKRRRRRTTVTTIGQGMTNRKIAADPGGGVIVLGK